MYTVHDNKNHLLLRLEDHFSGNSLRMFMRNELRDPAYAHLDHIWFLGNSRALISLGELLTIVDDFHTLCPKAYSQKKIAIVVDRGLTEAIMRLLANGIKNRRPFDCQIFQTQQDAEKWLGLAEHKVA